MFDFHNDKERYFDIQRTVTVENIIPFLDSIKKNGKGSKNVLEIGCAEAGVLKAFLLNGDKVVGVELSPSRFESAKQFLSSDISLGNAMILNKNIYDIDPNVEFKNLFDIIILKDVIEHIPEQEKFIPKLKEFLTDDGIVFFAYPPWWMPFGGHQQICSSKILRTLPWFHLLPNFLYTAVLKYFGENKASIAELMEVKSTGINIERLYSILKDNNFIIRDEIYWFINPIYFFKFGLKKRKVYSLLTKIPYLRNYYTTAHYIAFSK
ncbi:MAG: methyltransferase domain-containing protein [Saprospiraceae bacterium]|nr:methyltransferase domain-containing protein [Saprospiraceae bacterium]